MRQTDTLVLCRQRCGLHCRTCNPGNTVNKELLLYLFLFFFVCHDVFPHQRSRWLKGLECGRGRQRLQQRVCNEKSRWLESNHAAGQNTSGPQPRGQVKVKALGLSAGSWDFRCFSKQSDMRHTTHPSGKQITKGGLGSAGLPVGTKWKQLPVSFAAQPYLELRIFLLFSTCLIQPA